MPEPLRSGLARAHAQALFSQLTGRDDHDWLEACDTAPAGRLPLVMLAPIVTAFEHAMSEGEGRNTWRTDRYSPCPAQQAAGYLTLLASLGYQLSAIEQAVAGQPPTPARPRPGTRSPAGPDQPGPGPGDGPEGPVTDRTSPAADGPPAGDGDVPGEAAASENDAADGQAAA